MSYFSNSGRRKGFQVSRKLIMKPEEAGRLLGKTGAE